MSCTRLTTCCTWASRWCRSPSVLRRMAPHWLGSPGMRDIVVGFEEAARGHGGSGALYVRIRRAR